MCAGSIVTVFRDFIRNKVEKVSNNQEHVARMQTHTWNSQFLHYRYYLFMSSQ